MALVVTDLGQVFLLNWSLQPQTFPDPGLLLHLYKNDFTPVKASIIGDFVEADYAAYSPRSLFRDQWQSAGLLGGIAQSVYGTEYQFWLASAFSQTVYGYYVTDAADTVAIWAERLVNPITISTVTPLVMQPYLTMQSESNP